MIVKLFTAIVLWYWYYVCSRNVTVTPSQFNTRSLHRLNTWVPTVIIVHVGLGKKPVLKQRTHSNEWQNSRACLADTRFDNGLPGSIIMHARKTRYML